MKPLSEFLTVYRGGPDVFGEHFPRLNEYKLYASCLQRFHNIANPHLSFIKKRLSFKSYADQFGLMVAAIYHHDNPETVRLKSKNSHLKNHENLGDLLSEVHSQLAEQWKIIAKHYTDSNTLGREDATLLQHHAHTQAIYAVMTLRKDDPFKIRELYPKEEPFENIAA